MRLLWIVNVPLAEASELWGLDPVVIGGWLEGAAAGLVSSGAVELHVAFPLGNGGQNRRGDAIHYHTIPRIRRRSNLSRQPLRDREVIESLVRTIQPDVVHLWGTETTNAWRTVQAARAANLPVVVSIQGLVGPYARHYFGGLPTSLRTARHWADAVVPVSPRARAAAMRRGRLDEQRCVKSADLVVGRTNWDRAAIASFGSTARYHHCDEILRTPFFRQQWEYSSAEPFRLFTSQAHVSYKGLHVALEAVAQVQKEIPTTRLVVAGEDPRTQAGPYAAYVRKLLRRWNLESSVSFIGVQGAEEIARQMLLANVFVLPSFIENSPNSLGEAMLLGVPCVASYVGGVPDMLTHEEDGLLYQADAPYMLAYQLTRMFEDMRWASGLGQRARARALVRHDPERNTESLLMAYRQLLPHG